MIKAGSKTILNVENLSASTGDKQILKGLDIEVKAGEVHAIMGPNGSGKSTFSKVIAGHPSYRVDGGDVTYNEQDLLELKPDERAKAGICLLYTSPSPRDRTRSRMPSSA